MSWEKRLGARTWINRSSFEFICMSLGRTVAHITCDLCGRCLMLEAHRFSLLSGRPYLHHDRPQRVDIGQMKRPRRFALRPM